MFGSSDSGVSSSGTVLIPTRFVWPHGGRKVFLSGTFTRWQDHLPMSPVEGCPTVFQVVYNLTPGYHQYKFCVDGEWRHDENQPFVGGNFGVVNTILLQKEPDVISAIFSTEMAGRLDMEVDNVPFHPEVVPSISHGDLELSLNRVSLFLSSHTAYELLPESGKVIALDVNLPVKQAFHILYEQGVSMAPLWDDGKSQFVGVLSASDFILILRELGSHGSNLTEEELETHTISAWKEGKAHLNRQATGNSALSSKNLVHAGPYDSLRDVAVKLVESRVSTVPIINFSSQGGLSPNILHMASLSGILKCICRYFKHSSSSLPILQQPICSIPVGTWAPKPGESNRRPIAMLKPNASLSAALSMLLQADVSSIPIVDENDSLVDIYCRSDITALAKDRAYTQVHLDNLSMQQALQLGQDPLSPYAHLNGQRCQMCLRSDPLHKIMERLSISGVRRVVIVEAGSKRVEGIISLSDVFSFLLGPVK